MGEIIKMNNDLISRSALLKAMEEERQYLLARGQKGAEHILVHHCLPLIDNAPTVEIPDYEEQPRGEIEARNAIRNMRGKDNAPSVEEKMYREETCNHKNSCDDYKYWHCIGCNGCKKGGAE